MNEQHAKEEIVSMLSHNVGVQTAISPCIIHSLWLTRFRRVFHMASAGTAQRASVRQIKRPNGERDCMAPPVVNFHEISNNHFLCLEYLESWCRSVAGVLTLDPVARMAAPDVTMMWDREDLYQEFEEINTHTEGTPVRSVNLPPNLDRHFNLRDLGLSSREGTVARQRVTLA